MTMMTTSTRAYFDGCGTVSSANTSTMVPTPIAVVVGSQEPGWSTMSTAFKILFENPGRVVAEDVAGLAHHDEDGDTHDEAGHDRVGNVVDDDPELQRPEHDHEQAGQEGHGEGRLWYLGPGVAGE